MSDRTGIALGMKTAGELCESLGDSVHELGRELRLLGETGDRDGFDWGTVAAGLMKLGAIRALLHEMDVAADSLASGAVSDFGIAFGDLVDQAKGAGDA